MSLWQFLTELFAGEELKSPPLHLLHRVDAPVPLVPPPDDDEIDAELDAIARPYLTDHAHSPDPWAGLLDTLTTDNERLRQRMSELQDDLARAVRGTPDFKL